MRQPTLDNIFASMTPKQCTMARAALGLSRDDLASLAGLGASTVVRFEAGTAVAAESVTALREALERGGVEFIAAGASVKDGKGPAGVGVRLRG